MEGLVLGLFAWDNPLMKLVTDDRCRIQSRELFKPNTPYQGERTADGRIQFVELVEKDVPVIKIRRVKGRLVSEWPRGTKKATPDQINAAIRADRESR